MRVITYNLARLTGEAPAVAEVLRAAAPDVVGVQEPPRGPWGRARLRRTARAAGLAVVLAGRGARTTALLASPRLLPAAHVEVLRLPWWGSRFVRRWWARRGVVLARLGGVDLAVVHPALDPVHRIDLVLHDPSLRVRRAEVLDGALVRRASDHLPLLVELDVHQARR